MTIDTQLVSIRMVKGTDTKADSKSAPTGDLDELVNATFQAPGKIQKRNGYDALSTTSGPSVAVGLASRANELLLMDGANAYSRNAASDAWVSKGPLPSPTVGVAQGIQAGSASAVGYDCAQHSGGLMMMAAELWSPLFGAVGATCSGVVYSVIDTTTGNVVVSRAATQIAAARNPKVLVVGSNFLLYYTVSTTLYVDVLPVATPTATPANASVATVSSTTPNYDVTYSAPWSLILLATCNNTGTPTNGVQVQTFAAATPTVQYTTATIASVSARTVSVCFDPTYGGSVWVAWITSASTISYYVWSNTGLTASPLGGAGTLASATGATALTLIAAPSTATNVANGFSFALCYYTVPDAQFIPYGIGTTNDNGRDQVKVVVVQAYNAISSATTLLRGARLAGKGFTQGPLYDIPFLYSPGSYIQAQTPYVPVIFSAASSSTVADPVSTLFVVQGITGQAVVRMWQGTSVGQWFNSTSSCGTVPGMLPECTALGGGSFLLAAGEVTQFSAPAIGSAAPVLYSLTSARAVTIDFADPTYGFQSVESAGSALFSGGCPTQYDGGSTTVEHGFNYSPYRLDVTWRTVGGILAAGTYGYCAIYEWIDANGIVHWSGASTAVSVTTTGSTSSVSIGVPTLRMTSKTGVRVVLFRTLVNGTVYYRLTNTGGSTASDALLNVTSSDYVTYSDTTVTDTVLASRAQLYTTGGTIENDPPPPMLCPVVHKRRVIGIDASNRNTLWYSKQVGEGTPVEFSLAFVLGVSPLGGDCTALASLDDKLVAFKRDRIFMFTGQGPDATGGQNDWSDSIPVSGDVGCIAAKSIVVTPGGVMFRSSKGIYLLGRDLSVSYIGAPVEAFNAQAVLSGTLCADVQQVRMQQAAQTLVYDYGVQQWSVFSLPGTGVDALVWDGAFTYATSTGVVSTEVAGQYHDPGSAFIPMSFLTSWISLAGLQGFQRVRRLLLAGAVSTISNVNISLATNYDPEAAYLPVGGGVVVVSSAQAATFAATRTQAGNWQERIHVTRQKCEAIQIGFTETQNGTTYDAYLDLSAISLEVGIKRGLRKMAAAESTG